MKKFALLIPLFIFAVDRLTKYLAFKLLTGKVVMLIPHILSLRYAENRGAAFSIFSRLNENLWNVALISVPLLICLVLTYYIIFKDIPTLNKLSFSLILGGALGNIYDRVFYGKVIDFIDLHFYSYHWPTFNVADISIFFGCVLIILSFKR